MNKHPWLVTKEQLEQTVLESKSIAEVLRKLSLPINTWHYSVFKNKCEKFNINTNHFLGMAWVTSENSPVKQPLDYYFNLKIALPSTHRLKFRLIKEGYFEHKCYNCELTQWKGQPIPIELNHIDGNHKNNELTNFELLCPNCHAQTTTYRGKNKK